MKKLNLIWIIGLMFIVSVMSVSAHENYTLQLYDDCVDDSIATNFDIFTKTGYTTSAYFFNTDEYFHQTGGYLHGHSLVRKITTNDIDGIQYSVKLDKHGTGSRTTISIGNGSNLDGSLYSFCNGYRLFLTGDTTASFAKMVACTGTILTDNINTTVAIADLSDGNFHNHTLLAYNTSGTQTIEYYIDDILVHTSTDTSISMDALKDSGEFNGAWAMWYDGYNDWYDCHINSVWELSSDTTPPVNSTWNVTSKNLPVGENSSVWNGGGQYVINVTNNTLALTVTTDENSNGSCAIGKNWNYTTMIADNANYKFATTETTSHSYLIYDNISVGNQCLYCSFIDATGNEFANSSSGCLNLTRTIPIT